MTDVRLKNVPRKRSDASLLGFLWIARTRLVPAGESRLVKLAVARQGIAADPGTEAHGGNAMLIHIRWNRLRKDFYTLDDC